MLCVLTEPKLAPVGIGETKDLEPDEVAEEFEKEDADNIPYFRLP
jgi:hypothetical protein